MASEFASERLTDTHSHHELNNNELIVTAIPAFDDNYIWALQTSHDAPVIIVDPGDAGPVLQWLEQTNTTLAGILITHHHHDHTGGIESLVAAYKCPVIGPDNRNILGITQVVGDQDKVSLDVLQRSFQVISTPGHTLDHIAFYTPGYLFCGDTLFSGGCGRMFEGTPAGFVESLRKLAELPDATSVYCAHEYTLANLKFARAVEPDNQVLADYQQQAEKWREQNQPTVPSLLATERLINPFLRCHADSIKKVYQHKHGTEPNSAVDVFAFIRQWKDKF
ncbi:MAG: hydroxyacylglutathione hydrolase [Idiomarina sp.]